MDSKEENLVGKREVEFESGQDKSSILGAHPPKSSKGKNWARPKKNADRALCLQLGYNIQ